jgi:hypothetical protein
MKSLPQTTLSNKCDNESFFRAKAEVLANQTRQDRSNGLRFTEITTSFVFVRRCLYEQNKIRTRLGLVLVPIPLSMIVSVGRTPDEHEPCVFPTTAGQRQLIIGDMFSASLDCGLSL